MTNSALAGDSGFFGLDHCGLLSSFVLRHSSFLRVRACLRFVASVAGPNDRGNNGNEDNGADRDQRNSGGDVELGFHQEHFRANENEHDRQPNVEKAEVINRSGEDKIKGTETEDGKDV